MSKSILKQKQPKGDAVKNEAKKGESKKGDIATSPKHTQPNLNANNHSKHNKISHNSNSSNNHNYNNNWKKLRQELEQIYKDAESAGFRSDKRLSKLLYKVSSQSFYDQNDIIAMCDIINLLVKLEVDRTVVSGKVVEPVVGTRRTLNALISYCIDNLANYISMESPSHNEPRDAVTIRLDRNLKEMIVDCIEKLVISFVNLYPENVVGMIVLVTPIDLEIALKMTASLLVSAKEGNLSIAAIPDVMPTLCDLLNTLTELLESGNDSKSYSIDTSVGGSDFSQRTDDVLIEDILANVAELIWTLLANGKTSTPAVYTIMQSLDSVDLHERSSNLESEMSMLNGLIKSLGAALWGNPPFDEGVFSLRIFWLNTLTRLRQVLAKLVLLYSKSSRSSVRQAAEKTIMEGIQAVKRLVDGHLPKLNPDEWDALADIIEFGLAPLIVGIPSRSKASSRSSRDDSSNEMRSKDTSRTSFDSRKSSPLKSETISLLHQFQFQMSSPPVNFNLILLRLLLMGEGVLDLNAAHGILEQPVEYIGQFMECVFTSKNSDAEGKLEALKMIVEPQFVTPRNPGSSYASLSMGGTISMTSQSTSLTQQWQQYYVNLPPPSIWEICVIHKAPGFINFFLQVLTDCSSYRTNTNTARADKDLRLYAIKVLGKIFRSLYTVSNDREYVLDSLINIACNLDDDEEDNEVKIEAIHQLEYALVASFAALVHTHTKVPRLVSALLQIARHWIHDALLASKALLPLCRLRSDEYGRASILPRDVLFEEYSEDDSQSKCAYSMNESDDDTVNDEMSVENDQVWVHPFLFFKRGDSELGVFRDETSSKRSVSKRGTILPMARVIACLDDIMADENKIGSLEDKEFLECMIYNTLEHWMLAGIDVDVDRSRISSLQSDAIEIARSQFLSSCVHYFYEEDEVVELLPDVDEDLVSYLSSENTEALIHSCRGLILVLNDKNDLTSEASFSILKCVLAQLETEVKVNQQKQFAIDRVALLLSVAFEYFSVNATTKIPFEYLHRTCQLCFRIASRPYSRESQLLAMKCVSLAVNRSPSEMIIDIQDKLLNSERSDSFIIDDQSNSSLIVLADLLWRRRFSETNPESPFFTKAGSTTQTLHKYLSRIAVDMKLFLYQNAAAWICEDSILSMRIGKSESIYQGWVEICVRSSTRCDRRLIRLKGRPSIDYRLIARSSWGNRREESKAKFKSSSFRGIDGNNSVDNQVNISSSEALTKAAAILKRFECIKQILVERDPPLCSNEVPDKSHRRGNSLTWEEKVNDELQPAAMKASDSPGNKLVKGIREPEESKVDSNQKKSQIIVRCTSDSNLSQLNTRSESDMEVVDVRCYHKVFHNDKKPLSIHEWLENMFGIHDIELKCADEIELYLQEKLGFDSWMLGKSNDFSERNNASIPHFANEKPKQLIYEKIKRGIAVLDRTVPVEPHKVAVFFSCSSNKSISTENETDEDRLLSAANASPQFWEFAKGLGSMVRNQDLTYFSSGLDTSERCEDGEFALVWVANDKANSEVKTEDVALVDTMVLFHVIPLMPSPEDNLLRNRKRHVGNDYVHVIYTERDASLMRRTAGSMWDGNVYTNSIIGGEFGLVTIFVDNLPASPMFSRVTVQTKQSLQGNDTEKLSVLRGSYIIPQDLTANAVRQIAIRADILCRSMMEDKTGLASNWEERLHLIRNMKRYIKL